MGEKPTPDKSATRRIGVASASDSIGITCGTGTESIAARGISGTFTVVGGLLLASPRGIAGTSTVEAHLPAPIIGTPGNGPCDLATNSSISLAVSKSFAAITAVDWSSPDDAELPGAELRDASRSRWVPSGDRGTSQDRGGHFGPDGG